MTEISFAPKEMIPQAVCRLEVMDADKADTYGPQIYLKLKVVWQENTTATSSTTTRNRDEDTGHVKQSAPKPGIDLRGVPGSRLAHKTSR